MELFLAIVVGLVLLFFFLTGIIGAFQAFHWGQRIVLEEREQPTAPSPKPDIPDDRSNDG